MGLDIFIEITGAKLTHKTLKLDTAGHSISSRDELVKFHFQLLRWVTLKLKYAPWGS